MIKCKCGFEITDKNQVKNVKITKFRFDKKSLYQYDHTGQCPNCGIEVIGVLTYKEQDIQEIIDKTLNGCFNTMIMEVVNNDRPRNGFNCKKDIKGT